MEILYNDEWGTVCDDGFDSRDADVVCHQLGHMSGEAVYYEFGPGTGTIWMDDVNCDGGESELGHCDQYCWGCHNCGHSEDVGVRCSK